MSVKSVAILGAGAIGAYFVWGLSDKLKDKLFIIAEGERAERLKKDGLVINNKCYELNVKAPKEAAGVDLLLVSTKYGSLRESLDSIAEIVGENTVVMSLLNGVDSEEIIAARIGSERILYSIMKITSERKGNTVVFNGDTTPGLFYGELSGDVESERVKAVAELLDGTPLHYHIMQDIQREMWYKYALNVSQNQPQAIIGVGFGSYTDSEHMAALRAGLRREVVEIARAKGIDISQPQGIEGKSSPTAKRGRYSTLQDLDAKRHTEVDMFAGTMIRLGKEYGIPTPYNEFAFHCIKALEQKNDGLFDYC